MFKKIASKNTIAVAIVLFMVVYTISTQFIKPAFLYNINGTIKEFGVGYKNKTIVPMWLFSIVLGILSYLFVLYYLTSSRFL
jgi:hypothetical protein